MSKHTSHGAAATSERELTTDELEHVSGGNGTAEREGGKQHEFIKITMNHVTVSNY